jgi:GDP-4-dehydro-6-deoxy-D-mannose reductase
MNGVTLVTGAAGFAGSHLLDALSVDGVHTVAWHRPGGHLPREVRGVRWQGVDLLDRQSVLAAIKEVRPSVVFHCAGAAHVGESWGTGASTLRVNVLGTHTVVEALRAEAPEAKLLITSSALVYGPSPDPIDETHAIRPANPYGLSKVAQEMVGSSSGGHAHTYIARPFNHFGPRQDPSFVSAAFARQIAEIEAGRIAPEIRVGNLDALRDLTDVRDTVRAYRLIVERGVALRPYNVCTGAGVAVHALLDMLVSMARVAVRVVPDPSRYRPNDTPVVVGNPSRTRRELGWAPAISFEQTVGDLLDYWRQRVRNA